jgi:hypothetical protein
MSINVAEPVFHKDVAAEEEYALEGWKTFYIFYQRLSAQGAPSELLKQVAELSQSYQDIYRRVALMKQYFPIEGR